jgi:hypothetical protein
VILELLLPLVTLESLEVRLLLDFLVIPELL